jgi:WD40 repeat protein
MSYKAFISYSHESDGEFADSLHDAMEKLAKPWTKRRARRVVLDKMAMSAGSSLSDTIEEKLADSEWLVLLASPQSAQSTWVDDEIDYWAANKSMDNVVVALTGGEIVVDARGQSVDWENSTALSDRFRVAVGDDAVPLYEDLRPFKTDIDRVKLRNAHFRDEVAKIVGRIEGEDPGELASEDKRQYAHSVRLRRAAEIGLVILTVAAVILGIRAVVSERRAVANEQRAIENEKIAEENARQARLEAQRATSGAIAAQGVATLPSVPDQAALLSLESLRTAPTVDAFISVINSVVTPTHFLWRETVPEEPIVGTAAWNSNGEVAAMGTEFGDVLLVSPHDGVQAVLPVADRVEILSVAFAEDDRVIEVLDREGWLSTWDVASASQTDNVWLGDLHAGVISRDGSTVATVADQSTIVLFDETGTEIDGWDLDAGFSDDCDEEPESCVIAINDDGTAVTWVEIDEVLDIVMTQVDGEEPSELWTTTDVVTAMAYAPGGNTLVVAEDDGEAYVFPGNARSPIALDTEADLIADAEFLSFAFAEAEGSEVLAVSGHLNGSVKLWDIDEERGSGVLRADLTRHNDEVRSVAVSPYGTSILSGGWDGDIISWSSASQAKHGVTTSDAHEDWIMDVTFVGEDSTLASVSRDSTVSLWDADESGTLTLVRSFEIESDEILFPLSIDASPSGDVIAVGFVRFVGEDDEAEGGVLVYDVASGTETAMLVGPEGAAESVTFSPDGRLLAAAFSDGPILVWRVGALDGPPEFELEGTASASGAVAFSGDSALLAAATPDGEAVVVWDMVTGVPRITVPGNQVAEATAVALNADGSILAWGDDTRLIGLWDVAADEPIGENLTGHREEITDLQFADLDDDGTDDLLVSTSRDATTRLWHVGAQRLVAEIPGHSNDVSAVDISPDGSLMVTSGYDKALWVGELHPETWVTAACALAGRNMSFAEWDVLPNDEAYVRHCEQFESGTDAPADAGFWAFEFAGVDPATDE